jgi:hypothetical protein
MDAKHLFFASLDHFKERNREVLAQVQLQKCRNERWFARELALSMNRHLSGTWAAKELPTYADCEEDYADISVWNTDDLKRDRLIVYEVKTLYRTLDWNGGDSRNLDSRVIRAREQLARPVFDETQRKLGIFLVFYDCKGDVDETDVHSYTTAVRDSIRRRFHSDHDMRLTELCPRSAIRYWPSGVWHTQSWITWGEPT